MGKLKIIVNNKGKDTIARTIRMSGETFDRITLIAEQKGISFNSTFLYICFSFLPKD